MKNEDRGTFNVLVRPGAISITTETAPIKGEGKYNTLQKMSAGRREITKT